MNRYQQAYEDIFNLVAQNLFGRFGGKKLITSIFGTIKELVVRATPMECVDAFPIRACPKCGEQYYGTPFCAECGQALFQSEKVSTTRRERFLGEGPSLYDEYEGDF